MIEIILYFGSAVFFAGSMWMVITVARAYRQTKIDSEKIEWAFEQLGRAIAQIESQDEDVIIAGLQVMMIIKDQEFRFKAFPRLTELAQSSNPQIRKYARVAIRKFVSSPDKGTSNPIDR